MRHRIAHRWSSGSQYLLAFAVMASAVAARWSLNDLLGEQFPFAIMLGVLLPLVLLVRAGPFTAAAIAGWLSSVYLFVPEQGSFRVESASVAVWWVYSLSALLPIIAGWLAHWGDAVEDDALDDAVAHHDDVTEQSPDTILDPGEAGVLANLPAASQVHVPSPDAVLGHTPDEIIASLVHERIRTAVTSRGEEQAWIEYRAPQLDGSPIAGDVTAGPFTSLDQRTVLVLMREMTERKRAQEELRYRVSQFETVLDEAPIGVYVIDADFRVAQVNPVAMAAFTSRTAGEVIGSDFGELLRMAWPGARGAAAENMFRHTLASGESFRMPEFREEHADGIAYFDWRISRITLPDGRHGVVCYVIDITGQNRAVDALRESEARFQIAKTAAELGLHDYDVRANSVDWDARTRELWGAAPDEPITYELWRDSLYPDDREPAEAAVARALDPAGDGRYFAQYRVTHREDGVTRWIEATGQATFEKGEAIRLIGTVRDVTEQKQTEVILREDDRRKDEFIATLAHELRNPLAAIRMGLRVLESASGGLEQRARMHAIIDRQSALLVRLIDDLLDVSRITRGKIALQKQPIELARVIEQAVDATREKCSAKGVRLTLSLPHAPIVIDADAFRFAQVLTNLLSNACKFTDSGGTISISVDCEGGQAVVRVRDTGVGIPPEQLTHIFEMFAQVDKAHGESGLGIGLSLARLILELHGGTIEARSEGAGTGSEFIVRVPLTARGAPEQPSAASRADIMLESHAQPRRILAVDDNTDALQALALILREAGHVVETAEDGRSGIAKASEMRPDAVLLDIGLPDIDGYEVARRIRGQPWARGVLLVAITGWGRDSDKSRAAQAGFDAHLTKPADPDALTRLLAATREAPKRDSSAADDG
jgi:PAS domain S-box-containing protein